MRDILSGFKFRRGGLVEDRKLSACTPEASASLPTGHTAHRYGPLTRSHGFVISLIVTVVSYSAWAAAVYHLSLDVYLRDINVDDSFYYLSIARNFVEGKFSTADGANLTNGYQPLWAWILMIVYAVPVDASTAVRLAKLLEFALLLVGACCIMTTGRRAGWHPVLLLVIPVVFLCDIILYNGLETSPQVAIIGVLTVALSWTIDRPEKRRGWAGAAACCGLLPWIRLEAVAISVGVTVILTALCLIRRPGTGYLVFLVWAATAGGIAIYVIYNQLLFGTPLPVSGQVKNYWSDLRFAATGYDILGNAIAHLHDGHSRKLAICIAALCVVLASWLTPAYRRHASDANRSMDAIIVLLVTAYAARLSYSILVLHPLYDENWYYVPAQILRALLVPLAVGRILLLARLVKPAAVRIRWLELGIAVACLVVVGLLAKPWSAQAAWREHSAEAQVDWETASFEGTRWMNDNLQGGAVIGSPDSGVVGYFSRHRVINMDGLVNSYQFFSAMRSQQLEGWMLKAGITYVAGGMRDDTTDGCVWLARATVQQTPYRGPCELRYEASYTYSITFADAPLMRFRVFSFGRGAPAGARQSRSRR
jgi:hypothetical protein